jgi:hypothetical protein
MAKMLYFFNLLVFLIDISQETVLNWFGLEHPGVKEFGDIELYQPGLEIGDAFKTVDISPALSLDTFRLIIEGFWEKIKDGLSMSDIDNIIAGIIIIRFTILAIRYNLVTSFLINCIGMFAAYLWYRHFIQILFSYESILYRIPFTFKLGVDAYQIRNLIYSKIRQSDFNIRLTNPIGILLYAVNNGIVQDGHRIDPISIFLSWLPDNWRKAGEPYYYGLYRKIIPLTIKFIGQFYREISAFAAYTLSVRIGKVYCPYLIRWHWTMLVMMTFIEPYFMKLMYRMYYYIVEILTPQLEQASYLGSQPMIELQIRFLTVAMVTIIITHLTCILFAVFHALCGQYFYLPIFTDNVELHIGPRDKTSVYSGGYTSWQDRDEKTKKLSSVIPKFWYGWFGRGTKSNWNILSPIQNLVKNIIKKLIKQIKTITKRF